MCSGNRRAPHFVSRFRVVFPGVLLGIAGALSSIEAHGAEFPRPASPLRQSLQDVASSTWFDSTSGAPKHPPLVIPREPSRPSPWTYSPKRSVPKPPRGLPVRTPPRSGDWTWLVAVIVGILMAIVAYAFWRTMGRGKIAWGNAPSTPPRTRLASAEDLPFHLPSTREGLLEAARRLADEGRYGEAVVRLFAYQLLTLDKRHWITLAKGKTNRDYLCELGSLGEMVRIVEPFRRACEDHFFGAHVISRDRFEPLWAGMADFERALTVREATPHAA